MGDWTGLGGYHYSFRWEEFEPRGIRTIPDAFQIMVSRIGEVEAKIKEIIASHTPEGPSGRMKASVDVWELRITHYGVTFNAGWRQTTFGLGYKDFYPKYVVQGTGMFGFKRQRIFPVKKEALKFEYEGETVFARSVVGQPPRPEIFQDSWWEFQAWYMDFVQECVTLALANFNTTCVKGGRLMK